MPRTSGSAPHATPGSEASARSRLGGSSAAPSSPLPPPPPRTTRSPLPSAVPELPSGTTHVRLSRRPRAVVLAPVSPPPQDAPRSRAALLVASAHGRLRLFDGAAAAPAPVAPPTCHACAATNAAGPRLAPPHAVVALSPTLFLSCHARDAAALSPASSSSASSDSADDNKQGARPASSQRASHARPHAGAQAPLPRELQKLSDSVLAAADTVLWTVLPSLTAAAPSSSSSSPPHRKRSAIVPVAATSAAACAARVHETAALLGRRDGVLDMLLALPPQRGDMALRPAFSRRPVHTCRASVCAVAAAAGRLVAATGRQVLVLDARATLAAFEQQMKDEYHQQTYDLTSVPPRPLSPPAPPLSRAAGSSSSRAASSRKHRSARSPAAAPHSRPRSHLQPPRLPPQPRVVRDIPTGASCVAVDARVLVFAPLCAVGAIDVYDLPAVSPRRRIVAHTGAVRLVRLLGADAAALPSASSLRPAIVLSLGADDCTLRLHDALSGAQLFAARAPPKVTTTSSRHGGAEGRHRQLQTTPTESESAGDTGHGQAPADDAACSGGFADAQVFPDGRVVALFDHHNAKAVTFDLPSGIAALVRSAFGLAYDTSATSGADASNAIEGPPVQMVNVRGHPASSGLPPKPGAQDVGDPNIESAHHNLAPLFHALERALYADDQKPYAWQHGTLTGGNSGDVERNRNVDSNTSFSGAKLSPIRLLQRYTTVATALVDNHNNNKDGNNNGDNDGDEESGVDIFLRSARTSLPEWIAAHELLMLAMADVTNTKNRNSTSSSVARARATCASVAARLYPLVTTSWLQLRDERQRACVAARLLEASRVLELSASEAQSFEQALTIVREIDDLSTTITKLPTTSTTPITLKSSDSVPNAQDKFGETEETKRGTRRRTGTRDRFDVWERGLQRLSQRNDARLENLLQRYGRNRRFSMLVTVAFMLVPIEGALLGRVEAANDKASSSNAQFVTSRSTSSCSMSVASLLDYLLGAPRVFESSGGRSREEGSSAKATIPPKMGAEEGRSHVGTMWQRLMAVAAASISDQRLHSVELWQRSKLEQSVVNAGLTLADLRLDLTSRAGEASMVGVLSDVANLDSHIATHFNSSSHGQQVAPLLPFVDIVEDDEEDDAESGAGGRGSEYSEKEPVSTEDEVESHMRRRKRTARSNRTGTEDRPAGAVQAMNDNALRTSRIYKADEDCAWRSDSMSAPRQRESTSNSESTDAIKVHPRELTQRDQDQELENDQQADKNLQDGQRHHELDQQLPQRDPDQEQPQQEEEEPTQRHVQFEGPQDNAPQQIQDEQSLLNQQFLQLQELRRQNQDISPPDDGDQQDNHIRDRDVPCDEELTAAHDCSPPPSRQEMWAQARALAEADARDKVEHRQDGPGRSDSEIERGKELAVEPVVGCELREPDRRCRMLQKFHKGSTNVLVEPVTADDSGNLANLIEEGQSPEHSKTLMQIGADTELERLSQQNQGQSQERTSPVHNKRTSVSLRRPEENDPYDWQLEDNRIGQSQSSVPPPQFPSPLQMQLIGSQDGDDVDKIDADATQVDTDNEQEVDEEVCQRPNDTFFTEASEPRALPYTAWGSNRKPEENPEESSVIMGTTAAPGTIVACSIAKLPQGPAEGVEEEQSPSVGTSMMFSQDTSTEFDWGNADTSADRTGSDEGSYQLRGCYPTRCSSTAVIERNAADGGEGGTRRRRSVAVVRSTKHTDERVGEQSRPGSHASGESDMQRRASVGGGKVRATNMSKTTSTTTTTTTTTATTQTTLAAAAATATAAAAAAARGGQCPATSGDLKPGPRQRTEEVSRPSVLRGMLLTPPSTPRQCVSPSSSHDSAAPVALLPPGLSRGDVASLWAAHCVDFDDGAALQFRAVRAALRALLDRETLGAAELCALGALRDRVADAAECAVAEGLGNAPPLGMVVRLRVFLKGVQSSQ